MFDSKILLRRPGVATRSLLAVVLVTAIAAAPLPTATAVATAQAASAQDEDGFQLLHAPFTCGTEWSGTTRPGHGLNDWNLDLNRTSLVWPDRSHDLGQPLLAQADGVITWIGTHVSAGTYMEIDYGDITAGYIHMVPGSIPDDLEIGSSLVSGQFFGELGDSGNANGFAHLHLEYYDSRTVENARRWQLPSDSQIEIRMNGEIISPGEIFVSTNCDGLPPAPLSPWSDVDPTSFALADIELLYEIGVTTGTGPTTYSPDGDVTREQMAAFLARLWRILGEEAALEPSDTAPDGPVDEDPDDLTEPSYPFDDVPASSYAYDDIALMHELGITLGSGDGAYSPAERVTREQMAAFLARLLRAAEPPLEAADTAPNADADAIVYPFEDVDASSFARDDIAFLLERGITTGTGDGRFSPADDVTREQMAAFLARIYRELAESDEVPAS